MDDRAARFLNVIGSCVVVLLLIVGVATTLDAQAAGASFPKVLAGPLYIGGALLWAAVLIGLTRHRRKQKESQD